MVGVGGRDRSGGKGRGEMGGGVWISGRHLVILLIYKA